MKTIFILFCVFLVEISYSQVYEGDKCVDNVTYLPGRCCQVNSCSSAISDLRQGRGLPNICSFNDNGPLVCCRTACGSTAAVGASAPRKSEQMCAEYDNISITGLRKKRYAPYDHDYYHQMPAWTWMQSHESYTEYNQPKYTNNYGSTMTTPHTTTQLSYAAVGGVDTSLAEFPHMAAVGWPLKIGGFAFNCGGSLISDRFVLTAGHCLSNPRDTSLASFSPTIVRLGDQNILDSVTDGAEPLDVPIVRTYPHPQYRPPVKYFDVALLELESSVPFSDHIRPACLWTNSTFGYYTYATVTGWGTTVSGGRENSAILQKVDVEILDTSVCRPLLRTAQNRNWRGFQDHQLCAGVLAGGKDACQGDSGGPLQISTFNYLKKYYIIGVTSFGRECGKRNLPGVYTRVSSFLDWIEPIVWPEQ